SAQLYRFLCHKISWKDEHDLPIAQIVQIQNCCKEFLRPFHRIFPYVLAAGTTSKVVMIDLRSLSIGNSSRYSSVASFRFFTASARVCPWLTVPTSGHSATYMSSSL